MAKQLGAKIVKNPPVVGVSPQTPLAEGANVDLHDSLGDTPRPTERPSVQFLDDPYPIPNSVFRHRLND